MQHSEEAENDQEYIQWEEAAKSNETASWNCLFNQISSYCLAA